MPQRLGTLVDSVQRRVVAYRNDGIVHGKTTNVHRSFWEVGSDGFSARIIGVQLPGPPHDAPVPIDSEVPAGLLVDINEYLSTWFSYIAENADKCCGVPFGRW